MYETWLGHARREILRQQRWLRDTRHKLIYIDAATPHGAERRWFALIFFDEGQFITVPVLSQTFITSPTGSLQTSTSDATWNNANNKVECIGSGANGALGGSTIHCTGGGGGQYAAITNFSFATPGTTTYQWQVGTGAALKTVTNTSPANGNDGNTTWFNAASDPGAGADNTKCSAKGGTHGVQGTASQNGGAGGTGGWGTTLNAGGRGGNLTGATGAGGSGGGGAGGPNGAGGAGVDSATTGNNATNGGQGDVTSGGIGGTGNSGNGGQTGTAGTDGTELGDSVHGCGGGGGAARGTTGTSTGGAGGLYGGAGAGACATTAGNTVTSNAGAIGIIVFTWTPATSTVFVFSSQGDSAIVKNIRAIGF